MSALEVIPRAAAAKAAPRGRTSLSKLDVLRVREDFPILKEQIHGKPLVYLDNAATAQKPQAVLAELQHYYSHVNANVHRGAHELSQRATQEYEAARVKAQQFLNAAENREILFTRGTTEGVNLVAQTYGRRQVQAGDEIVVSAMEHHSNLVPWQMLCEEKGAKLRVIPINNRGELLLEEYARLLGPRTRLVAVSHVSNALGTINPVRDLIARAHERGIPVLVDGAQAVPHLGVDVRDLDCDFYVFSGHKVYGPTGIGVLYGKAALLDAMPPWQGGGDMIASVTFAKTTYNVLPYKFEAGTPHVAGAVALGVALDYVQSIGLDAIAAHDHDLLAYATELVSDIPGVRIVGQAAEKTAVLSFVVDTPSIAPLDVGVRLDLEGIAVRTGHHCCQPLMDWFGVSGTVRASFGMYNTREEVERFAQVLREIVHGAKAKTRVSLKPLPCEPAYPQTAAASPQAAAAELADLFDFLDDWTDRYQHIIELGEQLPAMPTELKTEEHRIRGCQSTVYLHARRRPGSRDIVEFLADSDAAIVRGELAILQRLFSGQQAAQVLAFDVDQFFGRLGLNQHLTMGRRNGLASMVMAIRAFAARLAAETADAKPPPRGG